MDRHELMRRHFSETLMDMCETRRLSDITVADLVERAGTARQTFYNHFSDINDLICYAGSLPVRSVSQPFADFEGTRRVYALTRQHRAFFSQLPAQVGQNNFWETTTAWLKRMYYERFLDDRMDPDELAYRKTCIDLYCSGSTAVTRAWCASGMEASDEAMARVMYAMTPPFAKDGVDGLPARVSDYPR